MITNECALLHHWPRTLLLLLVLDVVAQSPIWACTDILVTPGASHDGSAMIAYNADSPLLFGSIYHYEARRHPPGAMVRVYDWDSGVLLGEIPQSPLTYNVVGNSNEHGLVIGESTFGGVKELADNQKGAKIDYGSLIYLTLQRAKTVQEAMRVMVDLMDTHGYSSGGESFSLADKSGQVWMMEVIGRGSSYPSSDGKAPKLGAVWVAVRIPDGSVAAHANQARITTFARDDPDNCLFAPDVVDVAIHYGLYPADADPLEFSFSDVYDPIDFISARQGEARVWSTFSQIADTDGAFQHIFQPYAMGKNLTHRMPLYIEPIHPLSVRRVMHLMTSHYEGTALDSSTDVGAGIFASPYRPRPLVWHLEDGDSKSKDSSKATYHNERSIATAKTGWSFVAQVRPWMPTHLAAVSWYALDDSSTAPRLPVYSSSRRIAPAYAGRGSQDGVRTGLLDWDMTKAFWVQNMVSNFAYARWQDVYPDLREEIDNIQQKLEKELAAVDTVASQFNQTNEAVEYVTDFGVKMGQELHKYWTRFYGKLFVKYRDYYTLSKADNALGCKAREPGLSETVKERIVAETGDRYRVLDSDYVHPDGTHVRGDTTLSLDVDDTRVKTAR